jgi:hypothetical protein
VYKPNELKDDTTGIYKRFPKLSTYVKNINKWSVDYSQNVLRLEKCSRGEDFQFSHMSREMSEKLNMEYNERQYTLYDMGQDLGQYSTRLVLDAYSECFENNKDWENTFRKAITFMYWSTKIEFVLLENSLEEFHSGKRKQKRVCHLRSVGSTIGFCLSLGWLDFALDLRNGINFALKNEVVNDGGDNFGRRRTQHFLIRLINSYDGSKDVQRLIETKCAYDAPLLNELIENWDMKCNERFEEIIFKLCDRHTHQCRQDSFNGNRYYDFENLSLEYYYPLEVLSIFFLRKTRGLTNPEIDHPIMKSGLENIDQTIKPYESEYLSILLKFARESSSKI